MKGNGGSASVEIVLLSTLLMVFILLPVVALGIERMLVHQSINYLVETMESTMIRESVALDMETLSEGQINYDIEVLRQEVEALLLKELDGLVESEIIWIDFYPSTLGHLPCRDASPLNYDTLHIEMGVWYEHKVMKGLLGNGSGRKVNFHYDMELPKNR